MGNRDHHPPSEAERERQRERDARLLRQMQENRAAWVGFPGQGFSPAESFDEDARLLEILGGDRAARTLLQRSEREVHERELAERAARFREQKAADFARKHAVFGRKRMVIVRTPDGGLGMVVS